MSAKTPRKPKRKAPQKEGRSRGRPPVSTPEQDEEIRKRLIAGETGASIARAMNVSERHVGRIKREGKEAKPGEVPRLPAESIKNAAIRSVENDLNDPAIRPILDAMGDQDRSLFHSHKADLLEVIAQMNMASRYSAQNAHKLARMAQTDLNKIDETAAPGTPDDEKNGQCLMRAMSLQAASNEAAKQPMKLLEITLKAPPPPPEDKPIRIIGGLPDRDYGNQ